MKSPIPMPVYTLKIGQEIVKLDAIARWYLYHLSKTEQAPYWQYKTASDQISVLMKNKMARFIPGRYPSNDARLLQITDLGRNCLKALEAEEAKRKVKR